MEVLKIISIWLSASFLIAGLIAIGGLLRNARTLQANRRILDRKLGTTSKYNVKAKG